MPNVRVPTELSELIGNRMDELGMDIGGLKKVLDTSYEHARRIVRGEGVPSRPVLRLISQQLQLDFRKIDALATAAQIRKKYGEAVFDMMGRNPELEPIERAWPSLTEQQKHDAIAMITGWAKRSRGLR